MPGHVRRAVLDALRDGRAPSYARPLAERAAENDACYGAHCSLGEVGFADWTCDAGYRCDRFDASPSDATVGVCLPENTGAVGTGVCIAP